jgi:hypothetical protein
VPTFSLFRALNQRIAQSRLPGQFGPHGWTKNGPRQHGPNGCIILHNYKKSFFSVPILFDADPGSTVYCPSVFFWEIVEFLLLTIHSLKWDRVSKVEEILGCLGWLSFSVVFV